MAKLLRFVTCLLLLSGCIRETLDSCEQEYRILIHIIEAGTGADISAAGGAGDVDLFIFGPDGTLVERIVATAEQVKSGTWITLKKEYLEGYWISAWGNLNDEQVISRAIPACSINDPCVTLLCEEDGYYCDPADLFFGLKQLQIPATRGKVSEVYTEEIQLTRKNAQMTITVSGLPADCSGEDYYLTVCGKNDGYNFKGDPVQGYVELKQTGTIDGVTKDLCTGEAFNIIHSASVDQNIVIHLFGPETRAGIPLATATTDVNGNLIAPGAGETTHVLIELLPDGSGCRVFVAVTGWDEQYQWNSW